MTRRVAAVLGASVLAAALLAGCGDPAPGPPAVTSAGRGVTVAPTSSSPTQDPIVSTPATTPVPATPTVSTAPADRAAAVLAALDLRERVGQLIMTGLRFGNAQDPTFDALRDHAIGNVFLGGRSSAGVASVAALCARLQAAAPAGVPLLVATDQEGGQVQVLSGTGFDLIPSGLDQGGLDPAALQSDAARWGGQLTAAGVRVDLGPVLDTVPDGADNPPIGGYDREYGHEPEAVSAHGGAFAAGLAAAGVAAAGKHFPGLGRVDANTDTHAGVTDTVTTVTDPYLQPFRDAIAAGIAMIMVSSATYTRIDPDSIAAFSPTVVTGLLRGTLGFGGVVISDDLGNATAVAAVPVGERATRFVAAGGDLVLDVAPSQAPTLAAALLERAQSDPAFAARVDESALRVLELKARLGLLG